MQFCIKYLISLQSYKMLNVKRDVTYKEVVIVTKRDKYLKIND